MIKNIGKNISENLSGKYRQKLIDHPKQSATDALKTCSKKAIQKTTKATGDLIGNNFADIILKNFATEYFGKVTNEHDKHNKVIPKERKTEIIGDLRLI